MSSTDVHGELGELIAGKIPGRTRNDQRFVFDSTGIAVQDLAAAEMIYNRSITRGAGRTVVLNDSPAFPQSERPNSE